MQDILDFNPTRSIESNKQRAKIARALLLTLVCLAFVQLISDCAEYNMLEKYKDGSITTADEQWNNLRQLLISVVREVVTITCVVFFIMWFRRAYHNLHKLGVEGLSADEGWAAGAWFIPIFNFYRPVQLMRETWEKTVDTAGKVEDVRYERTNGSIIGFWWLFWIIRAVLVGIIATMPRISFEIESLQSRDVIKIFYAASEMSAGLFAMVMVKRLNFFENILFLRQEEIVRQYKLKEETLELDEELTGSDEIDET